METATETRLDTSKIEVRLHRGSYYCFMRSSALQRWGASQVRDESYYTLTSALWRASRKKVKDAPLPEGSSYIPGMRFTLYFDEAEKAEAAAIEFLRSLREDRGVRV